MAEGVLKTCLECGLECESGFYTSNGRCRICIGLPEDPVLDLLPEAPKWVATPRPKMEPTTNLWWIFRRNTWVVLAPYEYPEQKIPWLKK